MRVGRSVVLVVALLAGCSGGDGDGGAATSGAPRPTTTSIPPATTGAADAAPVTLEFDLNSTSSIHPVVAGDRVVTRAFGDVIVVDPATAEGRVLPGVGFGSELIAAGDAVVVDDVHGQLVVLDPADGSELARVEHPDGSRGVDVQTLWSDGERVAVGYERDVAVFDLAGEELYRVGTGDTQPREVVRDGNFLVIETVGDVTETALVEMPAKKASGAEHDAAFVALLSDGRTLVSVQPDGRLALGSFVEKTRAWQHELGRRWLPHPLVIDEMAWLVTEDGEMYLLDIATGIAQPVDTPGPTTRPPVLSDAGVAVVTDAGTVVVFDPDTGQPVSEPFQLPDMDEVNGFAADGSTLYVTAEQTEPDAPRDARAVLWGIDLAAL